MAFPRIGDFPKNLNSAVRLIRREVDILDAQAIKEVDSIVNDTIESITSEVTKRGAIDSFRRDLKVKTLDRIDETLDAFSETYGEALMRAQGRAGEYAGDLVRARSVARGRFAEIESSTLFDPLNVERLESLTALRTDLIRSITDDSRARIRQAVQRGVITGDSVADVQNDIVENILSPSFRGNMIHKAETIARTEMMRSYNTGHQIGLNRLGEAVPGLGKRWVTQIDDRTRETHIDMNNVIVDYSERFKLNFGMVELMFPTDPDGIGSRRDLAGETIQCRCTHVIVFPDER